MDKAQAHADSKKFDSKVFLDSRLAPDMFPLSFQIQMTCDTAKSFASKLSGKEAPKFEDGESSVAEFKERITKTLNYLESIRPEAFQGWEARQITNPRREGKYLPGNEWALQHALPNFFFHATTAYAILRHNGVEIGKKDFLGALNYRDI